MAGSARYTAILDACVLYPATLCDLQQKCDNVFDLALEYAQRGKEWAA